MDMLNVLLPFSSIVKQYPNVAAKIGATAPISQYQAFEDAVVQV
jgi:hypothetical protein